ncbi:MAG: hypothetical protein QNJ70_15040 [Xenococcaceae cyanobacterium MO_207.B15]|nr:hypothetical protein [Xenococcaceae cyanobacterium MO_207.B15]MDJ0743836.1 hypothetical protein [Xenococcaceae cyanobacterium MO_167.B27]
MQSLNRNKQKLALNLLHLLYVNKLKYNSGWESWVGYLIDSDNEWEIIDYPQLLNIAALIASGLTKKRANIEETKILLQQIERWVTQSNGKLVEVRESKHRTKWYPACLVETSQDKNKITA